MALSSTGPHLHFEAPPHADGALALAGAAGRLYQAITADTVRQMSSAECRAWMQFCDALALNGIKDRLAPQWAVQAADSLDAVRVDPDVDR